MMQISPADRIAPFSSYYFADLEKRLAVLIERKVDVIRLDMGSPDMPPPNFILDKLISSIKNPANHGYMPHGGTEAFKQAISDYYAKRFQVEIDPKSEILALIGTKEGLFNLCQAILNPGDIALVPDPGYPVYNKAPKIAGAEVYSIALESKNGYIPRLANIPSDIVHKAKILFLNYPNNPTGATACLDDFIEIVEYAAQHQILFVHDAAYTDICFDGCRPPSILQVPGAKEYALEFYSLSKTYNMAGWRVGAALGNTQAIAALARYKSQADSSSFAPLLETAAFALTTDQSWIKERNNIYQARRDLALDILRKAGLSPHEPRGSIYLWIRIPDNYDNSNDFCTTILENTAVSITPGSVYGKSGDRYFRISLTLETERFAEGVTRIARFLSH